MKICQIPHVIFESKSRFSLKFCINIQYHQIQPLSDLSRPIKVQLFETFGCFSKNVSNSSCQFWNNKSILQILHHSSLSWHKTPVNFNLIHFLLWIKRSHQSPYFETFECSGENLPNFSCHFPNCKSVFLQILHHSSVSRKITLLYLFSSDIIYFR